MKIICAGISKTGTKSLNAALKELGYDVIYDFMEHFWEHGKQWLKIFKHGGTEEDFREMYKNVDAALDMPVYAFWEEIHEAFPDSKIILTIRDEEEWVDGFYKLSNFTRKESFFRVLLTSLSPTATKSLQFFNAFTPLCHGVPPPARRWKEPNYNKMLLRKKFREHNSYVLQNAPKDKLLVFKLGDGWEPLCKFLGKEVPAKPYPWKNKDGSDISRIVASHPMKKKIQKEIMLNLGCLILFAAMLLYNVI